MLPWLWLWAPQYHYPLSGSVAQRIEPQTIFDTIDADAGDARVEQKAFAVASYGRQLGLITELLLDLANRPEALSSQGQEARKRLEDIRQRIELIKNEEARTLAADLTAGIERLRHLDSAEFQRLAAALRPQLAPSA